MLGHCIRVMGIGGTLLGVAWLSCGCPATGTVVYFDDPGLEAAIRQELGHPFGLLHREDLLGLQVLDARNRNIADLSGLEFCTNLLWLDLDTNRISDLTPLANLTNLMVLNLDSNQIFDISPLAGLVNLDSLSLFDNQIADIQALDTNAVNGGLGAGDHVVLDVRHLNETALAVDVPTLQGLGVNVITVVPEG